MATAVRNKGLYHPKMDMRTNLFELTQQEGFDNDLIAKVQEQAQSVACLMGSRLLSQVSTPSEGYRLIRNPTTLAQFVGQKIGAEFGENEKFRNEPAIGHGTAFLIGKQYALTAAHCVCIQNSHSIDRMKVDTTFLVFGFQMVSSTQCRDFFEKRDVYRIMHVIMPSWGYQQTDSLVDWAIVQLDREVEGRLPLELDFSAEVNLNERVYMLGHPTGIPLKLARNAEVKKRGDQTCFEANLDAFHGNSGSPVFSYQRNAVVGMLIQGNTDYETNDNYEGRGEERSCVRHIDRKAININGYEKCQKVTSLHFLKAVLPSIDISLGDRIVGQLADGLNLEAKCQNLGCQYRGSLMIIPLGFGKFNISKCCCNNQCPECKGKISTKDVNTLVLTNCRYSIDGESQAKGRINSGLFIHEKIQDEVQHHENPRFDVQDWYFLELDVQQITRS